MGAFSDASINELQPLGFNLQWDPTDRLSLALDYHDSEATRNPNSVYGTGTGVHVYLWSPIDISGLSKRTANFDGHGRAHPPDDLQISGSVFNNYWADMNIEQTQFDGSFELTDTLIVDFAHQTVVDNYDAALMFSEIHGTEPSIRVWRCC